MTLILVCFQLCVRDKAPVAVGTTVGSVLLVSFLVYQAIPLDGKRLVAITARVGGEFTLGVLHGEYRRESVRRFFVLLGVYLLHVTDDEESRGKLLLAHCAVKRVVVLQPVLPESRQRQAFFRAPRAGILFRDGCPLLHYALVKILVFLALILRRKRSATEGAKMLAGVNLLMLLLLLLRDETLGAANAVIWRGGVTVGSVEVIPQRVFGAELFLAKLAVQTPGGSMRLLVLCQLEGVMEASGTRVTLVQVRLPLIVEPGVFDQSRGIVKTAPAELAPVRLLPCVPATHMFPQIAASPRSVIALSARVVADVRVRLHMVHHQVIVRVDFPADFTGGLTVNVLLKWLRH